MANRINPIRKHKLKQGLLRGKSITRSMKDAGYKKSTAHRSSMNKSVKICIQELKEQFKASDITIEMVLGNLLEDRLLALKKGDLSVVVRVDELLGKTLAMFITRNETDLNIEKASGKELRSGLSGAMDYIRQAQDKALKN